MNVPARNLPRVVTIETQSPRLVYHIPAILFAQTLAHISSRELSCHNAMRFKVSGHRTASATSREFQRPTLRIDQPTTGEH